MATGGGGRAWQFLKRNDPYAQARLSLADGVLEYEDAPFPIRRQTRADHEAGPWGLLGWEDPHAANGPCSPIWAVAPMIEAVPAPAEGPGLAELARETGAALSGLRLADGALILKVERAGRARQVRIADGARFDAYRGSFVPGASFGRDWPRLNGQARDLWRMLGGPAPPAGRGTGTGSFSLRSTGTGPARRRARSRRRSGAPRGSARSGTGAVRCAARCAGGSTVPAT